MTTPYIGAKSPSGESSYNKTKAGPIAEYPRNTSGLDFVCVFENSYAVVGAQYVSNARASSCAIAGAVEVSIAERCIR
ncbi:hypothetical protein BH10ACI4_BH10ACI4_27700 [soil metagenome]